MRASSSSSKRAPQANPNASQMVRMISGMTSAGASDSDSNRVTPCSIVCRNSARLRSLMSVPTPR
jgi:hypothetical protein